MAESPSISCFVRDPLVSLVEKMVESGVAPSMKQQNRVILLAEMAETEYSGTRDPFAASALNIARAAVDFFVHHHADAGHRLLELLKFDAALRG